jgi:hypothetical protein
MGFWSPPGRSVKGGRGQELAGAPIGRQGDDGDVAVHQWRAEAYGRHGAGVKGYFPGRSTRGGGLGVRAARRVRLFGRAAWPGVRARVERRGSWCDGTRSGQRGRKKNRGGLRAGPAWR